MLLLIFNIGVFFFQNYNNVMIFVVFNDETWDLNVIYDGISGN